MKIVVGSKNPTKIKAVESVFHADQINSVDAPSDVSLQPFSDEETRQGAVNRARYCSQIEKGVVGIGLEGGLMSIEDQLYLCNWGALVTSSGKVYTAGGARVWLPPAISTQLQGRIELGCVMDNYAKKKDVSKREGAIGILTNNRISRRSMFIHILELLKGQWEY